MWSALFPGQGSQHPGMGKFLYDNFRLARELFEEASDHLSLDFKKLCFTGPEEKLTLTENTQPCLLLVSTASYLCLKESTNFKPSMASGHSIGEYAALVTQEALKFEDAIKAVRLRGQFMQGAVPKGKGAMVAAMGLSPKQALQICRWAENETGLSPLEPANYNAPGQIVLSGKPALISYIIENFQPKILNTAVKRVRFIPLKVSAPFHCSLMRPAEEKMGLVLNAIEFTKSKTPIIQNVCAKPVTAPGELRHNLISQISSPVRWVECIEEMRNFRSEKAPIQCIEFGAGKVLAGLVKKIDSENFKVFNMNSLEEFKAIESIVNGS